MTEADGPTLRIRVHRSTRQDELLENYRDDFDRSVAETVAADLATYSEERAAALGNGVEVDLSENKVDIKHPSGRSFDATVFSEDAFDASYWPLAEEGIIADKPVCESYLDLTREEFAYFLNQFLRSGRIIREDDPEADAEELAGDVGAATVVLYRPVGPKELALIEASGFRAFPPRLPEQPIFYPVTNEAYATQIARDWNTRYGSKEGFVTRFKVRADYLQRFERKRVGGAVHEEFWIPAEDLDEFNRNIVGAIEVISRFSSEQPQGTGSAV